MSILDEVQNGLEGVLAFATEIAEPNPDGNSLRYRGIELDELVGTMPFEQIWGLLVDDRPEQSLQPQINARLRFRTGDVRADLQSAIASLSSSYGLAPVVDLPPQAVRDQLGLVSGLAISICAALARPTNAPRVSDSVVAEGRTLAQRFLLAWRGELDPVAADALDAYLVTAAEHGMNASTFTARVIASTGADVAAAISGAIGALSGPLHGGAPARVLQMLDEVERSGDPERYVTATLARGERLMGFGHRVYRAEDPRARVLRNAAQRLRAPRLEVATELERAALAALASHKPDRVLATNVEFWSAVVLDLARVPQALFTPVFACSRVAGWSAHILEQRCTGRLIRPASLYVGRGPRSAPRA